MSWGEIAKAGNSTPSIAPLNEYFLLNEYKTYGETGFLGNYPELLDILAKSPLALNDLTATHRFLHAYANEHNCFGEMLGQLYDIPVDLSEYKTYGELFSTTDKEVFDAVAASESLNRILTSNGNNYSYNWQNTIKTNVRNGNYFGYEHGYDAFAPYAKSSSIINGSGIPSAAAPFNIPLSLGDQKYRFVTMGSVVETGTNFNKREITFSDIPDGSLIEYYLEYNQVSGGGPLYSITFTINDKTFSSSGTVIENTGNYIRYRYSGAPFVVIHAGDTILLNLSGSIGSYGGFPTPNGMYFKLLTI